MNSVFTKEQRDRIIWTEHPERGVNKIDKDVFMTHNGNVYYYLANIDQPAHVSEGVWRRYPEMNKSLYNNFGIIFCGMFTVWALE